MSTALFAIANVSDLAKQIGMQPSRWAMVRIHFGIQSFGVNATIADEPGLVVIPEHDEIGERAGRHEELYFVSEGHAVFTVNGDEIDAPAGTFVFVRDPAAKRAAVAKEASTTVIAVGGKPGEAFTPSPWERNAPALAYFGAGEYEKAVEELERLRAETPDDATVLYNLACAESLSGQHDVALEHLQRSIEIDPDFRELAGKDSDFDAIRERPQFSALTAPDAAKQTS
jgi:tetratricopeptide (TPR) repeat protein